MTSFSYKSYMTSGLPQTTEVPTQLLMDLIEVLGHVQQGCATTPQSVAPAAIRALRHFLPPGAETWRAGFVAGWVAACPEPGCCSPQSSDNTDLPGKSETSSVPGSETSQQ